MIQDIISGSVGLVYVIPIILFLYTRNPIHIRAFCGAFLVILTEYTKRLIGKKSTRPEGATNCNFLCNNGDVSGQPGMPSGHSLNAAFFAGFYYQYTKNVFIRSGLIVYAGLIMLSRYIKKCHTIGQISIGASIGFIFSRILYRN